jgi:hypothetical protein
LPFIPAAPLAGFPFHSNKLQGITAKANNLSSHGIDHRQLRYYFMMVNRMHHAYSWNQKFYKQGIEQKYSVKD